MTAKDFSVQANGNDFNVHSTPDQNTGPVDRGLGFIPPRSLENKPTEQLRNTLTDLLRQKRAMHADTPSGTKNLVNNRIERIREELTHRPSKKD